MEMEVLTMYTEHYDNGDIRVTFTSKESYWDFLEVPYPAKRSKASLEESGFWNVFNL